MAEEFPKEWFKGRNKVSSEWRCADILHLWICASWTLYLQNAINFTTVHDFLYVLEFSLWVPYWEILHLSSSKRIVYNFLFVFVVSLCDFGVRVTQSSLRVWCWPCSSAWPHILPARSGARSMCKLLLFPASSVKCSSHLSLFSLFGTESVPCCPSSPSQHPTEAASNLPSYPNTSKSLDLIKELWLLFGMGVCVFIVYVWWMYTSLQVSGPMHEHVEVRADQVSSVTVHLTDLIWGLSLTLTFDMVASQHDPRICLSLSLNAGIIGVHRHVWHFRGFSSLQSKCFHVEETIVGPDLILLEWAVSSFRVYKLIYSLGSRFPSL